MLGVIEKFYAADAARLSPASDIIAASIEQVVKALVVERALHPGELVPEFPHVRAHALRVERVARAPDLERREMVRAIGLLHDFVAKIAARAAARLAERL